MYICVDKLQNIYFNMKDTEHVANAFSFSLSETIKGFVFSFTFVCWNITLQAGGLGPT